MKSITTFRIIRSFLIWCTVLLIFSPTQNLIGDDRLEQCELLLRRAQVQIRSDAQLIADMQDVIDEQQKRIAILEVENTWLTADLKAQKGWYFGASTGYPWPSFNAMALYKFNKWGFYGNAGYAEGPLFQAGILFKFR